MTLVRGRYRAREASSEDDLRAAQALRYRVFSRSGGMVGNAGQLDSDTFDDSCVHVLIEDQETGQLVCCYRLLVLPAGRDIDHSYSAQYYDLTRLFAFPGPLVELGRFCIDPNVRNSDVLRVAWAALTRFVDAADVKLLFGCTSFAGTEPAPYAATFGLLAERHLAPMVWLPGQKSKQVERLARHSSRWDRASALRDMPPLLRTYLAMGGWVSDHAVVDPYMNTLHVFTGVEIARIPEARKRALRALAEDA
ncbi:GNAT family N-acetyltransferase [Pseudaestuariivita sp.]|uniref:GNAT family N-acetyltransferase n=1 Tax=Pseudaestuariivita sp. TaxID=2211669 RepID=UPI00405901E9